jgi:hypothetical protein
MTKLWVAAQTLPPTGSGGDAFDDAFNESVRSVMYFAWPWIAAVFLLLISGACLLWYRNDPYEKGPLFAALGAGVLAVASGVLGYFRLDAFWSHCGRRNLRNALRRYVDAIFWSMRVAATSKP